MNGPGCADLREQLADAYRRLDVAWVDRSAAERRAGDMARSLDAVVTARACVGGPDCWHCRSLAEARALLAGWRG